MTGPLRHATLDVAVELEAFRQPAYLDGLPERLSPYSPEELIWLHRVEYDVACNWKVLFENLSEAYHLPYVHKSLNDKVAASDASSI